MNHTPAPPRSRDLPGSRLEYRKEALMQQIHNERSRRTARERTRVVAALIPAALLGIAATGYLVVRPDEVVAAGIGCYSATAHDANVTVIPTTGGDPIKACARLWAEGVIDGSDPNPELSACINSGRAVAVFPTANEKVCARLGMQPLPEGYREAARRFAQMTDAVHRELYRSASSMTGGADVACLDEGTALEAVNRALERHAPDWSVEFAQGDYGDRTCMNAVSFEDADKRILIIPSEPGVIPWHRDPTM